MAYETVLFDMVEPHIARVTINRPDRMNALNRVFFQEMAEIVEKIEKDDDILAWLITGGPRADGRPCFSAGVDLKGRTETGPTPPWLANSVINAIDDMLKPSIAVADGVCTTGGMELLMSCDFRVAAETAQFSDWHLKRLGNGLGAWGASTRLPRLVGVQKAKEILLTGIPIDGREAHRIGLVNRVTTSENLLEEALSIARPITQMRPEGVKITLAFLQSSQELDKQEAIRWAAVLPNYMGIHSQTDQAAAAFVEEKKR